MRDNEPTGDEARPRDKSLSAAGSDVTPPVPVVVPPPAAPPATPAAPAAPAAPPTAAAPITAVSPLPTPMTDDERKHLEMIQAAITRMASNSFVAKGWSVTAVSALLAFAAGTKHQWIALIALLPTIVFWSLDGYYLALERRYRCLFNAAAKIPKTDGSLAAAPTVFSLDASPYETDAPFSKALVAPSVWSIHLCAIVTVAVVYVAITSAKPTPDAAAHLHVDGPVDVRVLSAPPATPPPATNKADTGKSGARGKKS